MTGGTEPHPAPQRHKLSTSFAFFILFGGPIAWFVQLCLSVALLGWSCFPTTRRFAVPVARYGWTRSAALIVLVACLAVALASGVLALRKLREVGREKEGGHARLIEIGHGRTRFTALWGVVLGFGFALAILATGIPFLIVSQCTG